MAVANLAKVTSTLTEFRLRNYLAVSTTINFEIEMNNYLNNALSITPNYGAASCVPSNSPEATQRWACSLNLAPGAAGNEPISFSTSNCAAVSNNLEPYVRISITSPDPYLANNTAQRALCQ